MKYYLDTIEIISKEYQMNALFLASLVKWTTDTVKFGNKECFDKEKIGIKEIIMDYHPFYTINLLLDKELLPI